MVRLRIGVLAAVLALGPALVAGCGGGDGSAPADDTYPGVPASVTVSTVTVGGRAKLDGFGEITVTVVDADGRTRTFCLLLADTPELQQQGLMYVTDPALGGYDGMVFSYGGDQSGGFWMRHTRLPLSIAWIGADGSTTSTTDMAPCPDTEATCPVYPSGGAYRFAVEVVQGRLGDLGISDRSRVSLGERACTPR